MADFLVACVAFGVGFDDEIIVMIMIMVSMRVATMKMINRFVVNVHIFYFLGIDLTVI